MALGSDNSITVTGNTTSDDFPTTNGAYNENYIALNDVFITRISADGSRVEWSTFLGHLSVDIATVVRLEDNGDVTVAGTTWSNRFPVTDNAYDQTFNGDEDAFAARLSNEGSELIWSTFLGGAGIDIAFALAIGHDGSATVAGNTESPDFPTTSGAYDESFSGGSEDVFVTRLSKDGSSLDWSTFLGGSDEDEAIAVAIDSRARVIVAGDTESEDFPSTSSAFDSSLERMDTYVARLSSDGSSLDWSTFFGGSGNDEALDLSLSGDADATIAGWTSSGADFPVTGGAFDTSYDGFGDAFVARLRLGISEDTGTEAGYMPNSFDLRGNYPNPFNPKTNIVVDLPHPATVTLEVYDITGRRVRTMTHVLAGGSGQNLAFDAAGLSSGVYHFRVTARMAGGREEVAGGHLMLVK